MDVAAPDRGTLRRRCWALIDRDANPSRASIAIDALLVSLICLSVAGIVLESVESLYGPYRRVFDTLERITVAVFSIEYLFRVWTAVEHPRVAEWPGGGLVQRLRYAATPAAPRRRPSPRPPRSRRGAGVDLPCLRCGKGGLSLTTKPRPRTAASPSPPAVPS